MQFIIWVICFLSGILLCSLLGTTQQNTLYNYMYTNACTIIGGIIGLITPHLVNEYRSSIKVASQFNTINMYISDIITTMWHIDYAPEYIDYKKQFEDKSRKLNKLIDEYNTNTLIFPFKKPNIARYCMSNDDADDTYEYSIHGFIKWYAEFNKDDISPNILSYKLKDKSRSICTPSITTYRDMYIDAHKQKGVEIPDKIQQNIEYINNLINKYPQVVSPT